MRLKKGLIFLLVIVLTLTFFGCSKKNKNPDKVIAPTPLVVGYDNLNDIYYNPFFFDDVSLDVVKMIHTPLVLFSRGGVKVGREEYTEEYKGSQYTYQAISDLDVSVNESNEAIYTISLKNDLVFSNGEAATIDDLIFSLYVLLDKTYNGKVLINQLDIKGLKNYQLNNPLFESTTDNEVKEELNNPSSESLDAIKAFIYQKLVLKLDEMKEEYLKGSLYQSIFEDPKDAFASLYRRDISYDSTDKTETEVLNDLAEQYEYNYQMLGSIVYKNPDYFDKEIKDVIRLVLARKKSTEAVESISGIKRLDDFSLSIETKTFKTQDIYKFRNIFVVPRKIFETKEYNYSLNNFGVEKENLSIIKTKTVNYGMGPYRFIKEENQTIFFEANPNYYLGEASLKYVQFRKIAKSEIKISLDNSTIDMIASPLLASDIITFREKTNVALKKDFFEGYGYLGINQEKIINENVRYAFMMLFASYRFKAINNTLSLQAELLNDFYDSRSIALNDSNNYVYNFLDELELYNVNTLDTNKEEAALNAFIEILTSEGFTYDDAEKKFTHAGEENSLNYKLYISTSATPPLNRLVAEVKAVLETKGILVELVYSKTEAEYIKDIKDDKADFFIEYISDVNSLDINNRYNSNAIGFEADQLNYFKINDEEIDQLLSSLDLELDSIERDVIFLTLKEKLITASIELPVYQKINYVAVNKSRLTYDESLFENTFYYNWLDNINLLNNTTGEKN